MTARERLVAAIKAQRLIVVVGTGVTAALTKGAPCASWKGLLQDGITRVTATSPDRGALLQMRLDSVAEAADMTGIAQDVKRFLGDDFGRWLARSVGELKLGDPTLANAIAELRTPILTTNYDTLLEQALGRSAVSWKNPSEMRTLVAERGGEIGHLHGTWKDSSSAVFSDEDYRVLTENEAAKQVQNAAFTMCSFLFVGVGDGLADPNFDPMIRRLAANFPDTAVSHFRLCANSDVDPSSELRTVVDVGYGSVHSELSEFLRELAQEVDFSSLDLASKSRGQIIHALRDNSTMWRDAAALDDMTFHDLVIPPTFLPEPHDQFATNSVVNSEKSRPAPVDIDELLSSDGVILIAGEENAGVSTALAYALHRALELRPDSHSLLVSNPLGQGQRPVRRVVDRQYLEWGLKEPNEQVLANQILGVDNLRADGTQRFQRACADIATSSAPLKIVGVRQADVPTIARALKTEETSLSIAHLGRFSETEAVALAQRVAPARAQEVARNVMIIIRDKNLPRTPFTLTLLVELVQSGATLHSEESEIAVLDQFLNLLLGEDFARARQAQGMTLRNKRHVLETIARRFVELREDHAPYDQVVGWLDSLFANLGWDHFSVKDCIAELISRRVLTESTDRHIRFQRSAYLELMAGLAAKDDSAFRKMVFEAPIQLASIVRSYAAMARNDHEVVELVEREIERIQIRPLAGSAFKRVRRIEAEEELFEDRSEADIDSIEVDENNDQAVERNGMTGTYYDDSPDTDTPAFLTAHVDELSEARVAMHVVDLASRVLRDSDEVRDQDLKSRVLRKLLLAWVAFTDLYEQELRNMPDLDEIIESFFIAEGEEPDDEERLRLKTFLLRVSPVLLTDSGIAYCLAGPSLTTRLLAEQPSSGDNANEANVLRVLALMASGGHQWVGALKSLTDEAVRSFFCASFLASRVRYEFMVDESLSSDDRDTIRAFLRRVIDARYTFKSVTNRNETLNRFEDQLRRDQLRRRKPGLALTN